MNNSEFFLNPESVVVQGRFEQISNFVAGYFTAKKMPREAELLQYEPLKINGWIINPVKGRSFDSVYICIDDLRFKAQLYERPDMSDKSGCLMSGFKLEMILPELAIGEHLLRVMGVDPDGKCFYANDSITLKVLPLADKSELEKYSHSTAFDVELQEICRKYGLEINDNGWHMHDAYIDAFREVLNSIPDYEPIALYGYEATARSIYGKMDFSSKNVVCIVERNYPASIARLTGIPKVPIVDFKDMRKHKFKKIIITETIWNNLNIKPDIYNSAMDADVIDIYDILRRKGIRCNREYSRAEMWIDFRPLLMAYKASSTPEEKQKRIKDLIRKYLECRDFVCAGTYIQEYIDNRYDDSYKYAELRCEIDMFLGKVRDAVKAQRGKKTFMFVFDSLSYDLMKSTSYIKELSENSLSFSNVYSPTFNTRAAYYSIFSEKNHVKDKLFELDYLNSENSVFYNEMKSKNIKVKVIGIHYFYFLNSVNDYEGLQEFIFPCHNWRLLMDILQESADCIYIIHTNETHIPFYSGNPANTIIFESELGNPPKFLNIGPSGLFNYLSELRDDAVKYLDRQFKFIFSFLNNERNNIIITSDHRPIGLLDDNTVKPHELDKFKIPLIIHSKLATPRIYSDIYSTLGLPSILRQLMSDDHELKIAPFDFARQESEPYYAKARVTWRDYGSVVIYTNFEKYTFHLNGDETYFLLSDMTSNLINKPEYKDRINYFRRQINIDTREVWKFMFIKYPHLMDIHKDRVVELLTENKDPKRLSQR